MAKVLISPIGTGRLKDAQKKENDQTDRANTKEFSSARKYENVSYKFSEDGVIIETPFLVAALAKYLKVDKVIFIGTAKSMWEEIYSYFTENSGREVDYEYWINLENLAKSSRYDNELIEEETLAAAMVSVDEYLKTINPNATGGSTSLIIKYGLNEEELWQNFSKIMRLIEILKDGDEVYLDITHSFRSIPLFLYLMMDFLQNLNQKHITLNGLYYGMLEVIGEMGYAPVVDLKPLFLVSQWIRGTYDFVNFGNGYLISKLIDDDSLREKNTKEISNRIENITELVNINYLTDMQNQIEKLNDILNKEPNLNRAAMYVIPLIKDFTTRFSGIKSASEFQLELSKWYFDNKRCGLGYICLVESVLTKLCEVYNLDIKDFNNREDIKNIFCLTNKSKELAKLKHKYKSINKIRRRIAHASFYQNEKFSFNADIKQANKNYEDVKRLLESKEINELKTIITYEEILKFKDMKKYEYKIESKMV